MKSKPTKILGLHWPTTFQSAGSSLDRFRLQQFLHLRSHVFDEVKQSEDEKKFWPSINSTTT